MVSDWDIYSFEESSIKIEDGDRGKNYPKKKDFTETGYCLFLNTGNVSKTGFKFDSNEFVSKERDELLRKGKLKRNDVVLTTRGTVGNVGYYDNKVPFENIRINSGMVILRSDPKSLLPRFLYLYLRSKVFKNQVSALQSGSAQPQLPIRDIKKIKVPHPPLLEQKVIAHILGILDDKIELNRQINETLETMAQALFKSWFVDFDPVIDNALLTGNTIPEPLKERAKMRQAQLDSGKANTKLEINDLFPSKFEFTEELGWIPKGWKVHLSNSLFDISDGTHDSPRQVEKGKYLITSRHITTGVIDFDNAYFISQEDFEEVNRRSAVAPYDILITMIGTVGISHIVLQKEIDFAIKNIGLFRTGADRRIAIFFYLYLKSKFMEHYLESRMAGTTQKYLTLKALRSLPVTKPNDELLTKFYEITSSYFNKIHANNQQVEALSKLRDTLLPKLMSGELRIADAEKLVQEM